MKPNKPDRVGQVFAALGKSVCYLALFVGMQVAVMLPAVFAAVAGDITGEPAENLYDMVGLDPLALTLISGLLTIAVVMAVYLIRRKELGEALWLRPVPAPTLLTGASMAPTLYLVVGIGLALLPTAWKESYDEAAAGVDSGTLVGFVAVALVAPVVEELIFRGLMLNRLSRAMPGWLAVVLSAATFGVCHGHPVWFAYAFVLGVVFGWISLQTRSILPSILGHLTFNAIGQVLSLLPESEDGIELVTAMGVLLIAAIAAPLFNRRAIGALFRRAPKAVPAAQAEEWELPSAPKNYDYNPWDE